ncbi:peptidoglycan-binding protein [bacterium]|nr:peptidoglycan-binding protein [bacterium]
MTRIFLHYFMALFLVSNISIQAFNPLVSQIQTYLREIQIDPGEIDGQYGPNTKAAIIKFQNMAAISPDGMATKSLLDKMRRYYALYTEHKYDYYNESYDYRYDVNHSNKCEKALVELSNYSGSTARYSQSYPEHIIYDSRWQGYSPRYKKRNTRITQKVNKLDRLMRRVKNNCKKAQYQRNTYKPKYVNRVQRKRYIIKKQI